IVSEPRVILFDEPLSNLDAKLREETRAELRDLLTRLAITSLYVTHDRFEALALSDDVVVMQGGNVVQRGTPEDVYFRSNTRFVVDFMGKANFLKGTVTGTTPEGHTLVATTVGPLLCEPATHVGTGASGMVAVRMEFIQVIAGSRPEQLPASHAVGTVTSVVFLGETREVEVQAGSERLVLRVPSSRAVVPGQEVLLYFNPLGCRFITE